MKRTLMTLSLLASLGLGATAQSGTIPQDVGVAQGQTEIFGDYTEGIQNAAVIPAAASANATQAFTSAAGQRTYVVMVGGYGTKDYQHLARYNNMGFFYNTLINKIGVPKNQIYCLFGFGDKNDWVAVNVPEVYPLPPGGLSFDFDGDGNEDIYGAASRQNLKAIIDRITDTVTGGDHIVFLFSDDVSEDKISFEPRMVMFNKGSEYDDDLSPIELASWISPLCEKNAGISVLFSQQDADAFVQALTKDGITVTSARIDSDDFLTNDLFGSPVKYPLYNRYPHTLPFTDSYDYFEEFVCKWISAFNEATPDGKPVNADYNGDGVVTMSEAFRWASANDEAYKEGLEHPYFVSTPNHVGHIQALAQPMYPDDLYLYTESGDTGLFYAPHSSHFWASPDIWVRKYDDTVEKNEIPYITYYDDEDDEYVYVKTRVHNRGWRPYTGGLSLQTYWSEECLEAPYYNWLGGVDIDGNLTGGVIGIVPISDYIAPLGSTVVTMRWKIPERNFSGVNVLAAIRGANGGSTSLDPIYHKGVARKSYSTIYSSTSNLYSSQSRSFKLYNNTSYVKRQGLMVKSHCGTATSLGIGTLDLVVPNEVYNYWMSNGVQMKEVTTSTKVKYVDQTILSFNTPNSSITNIPIPPQTTVTLGVTMNAGYHDASMPDNPIVDLILVSNTGSVIGGMELEKQEIEIINPILPPGHGILTSEISPLEVELTAQTVEGVEVVEWQDANGNFLGDGESLIVSPTPGNNTYTLISRTDKEQYFAESVAVPLYSTIERVYPKGGKVYEIAFARPAIEGTTVEAHGTMTGASARISQVALGELSEMLDLTGLPNDTYVVALKVNGVVTDTAKIVNQ